MRYNPNYTTKDWLGAFVWGTLAAAICMGLFCFAVQVFKKHGDKLMPVGEPVKAAIEEVYVEPVQTIEVTEEPIIEVVEECPELPEYSEQELEMLAMVIYQEAGGDACSNECRQMVGEVVLNRVADPRFPDTIYEVLSQPYQYGRLAWRFDWPERANKPGEAHAVLRAYDIAAALLTGSVERLLPEDVVFQAEFEQGTETVAHINGLYFCR